MAGKVSALTKDFRRDDFDDCPEGDMDFITDMLGTGFRDKMIETMGGADLIIPTQKETLTDDHRIIRALGRIDAEELVEVTGGVRMYVPMPKRTTKTKDRVAELVLEGKTSREIAAFLGITDRQVRRLRSLSGLNGTALYQRLGVSPNRLADAIRNTPHLLPAPQ